ncbi:MAG: hypothetical protein M3394_08165, partial [Actinomycetota bacterium]|nr:hypothetical protein [Actinomycetota bacterium]
MNKRRRGRLVLALVVAGIVLWGTAAAIALLAAQRDAKAGLDSIRAAQRTTAPKDLVEGRPLGHLRDAGRSFDKAEQRLDGFVLAPVRILPVAGRQLRSAAALAGAAADVSSVGADVVGDARRTLQ